MPNFNAVVGADQTAANKTLASIFANAPGLFSQQISVNQGGLNTIEVIINETPTISFGSTVTVNCPRVIMFDLSTGQGGVASIVCEGVFTVAPNNPGSTATFIILRISGATLTIPDNPGLAAQYNKVLAPEMVSYFNEYVLPIVRIPASYSLGGITISAPSVVVESLGSDPFLLAFTALGTVSPEPGQPALNPGVTSIGFDGTLINSLIQTLYPQQNFGDSGGIPTPNFSWDYHISLTPQSVSLVSGAIQISLAISGGVNFTFHTPGALPNVSFSGGLSGSCTATAVIETMPNGNNVNILLRLASVGGYSIKPSIDHLPSILNDVIGDVLGPLASAVGNTIGNNIDGSFHTLFSIPPAPIATSFQGGANLVLRNSAIKIEPTLLVLQADMIAVPRPL